MSEDFPPLMLDIPALHLSWAQHEAAPAAESRTPDGAQCSQFKTKTGKNPQPPRPIYYSGMLSVISVHDLSRPQGCPGPSDSPHALHRHLGAGDLAASQAGL